MIDRTHPLSMSRQAQLLDISRGAVYYLPKPTSASDLQIMHAMDRLHLDSPLWVRANCAEHFADRATKWAGFMCAH